MSVVLSLAVISYIQAWRVFYALDQIGLATPSDALRITGMTGAPVRWLLFGAFVSVAVLRHDSFTLDVRARRAAARVLVTLAFAAIVAIAITILATVPAAARLGLQPAVAIALIAFIVLSTSFRSLTNRVAESVYGMPLKIPAAAQQEAYLAAARAVAARGENVSDHPQLSRFRRELDMPDASARLIEQLVQSTTPTMLAAGQVLAGRYRVERALGRGGAGRVFLSRDQVLDREVVLKELREDFGDTDALREARFAGGLQHPNIITIHDVLHFPGMTLIVQEYADGGSLHDKIGKDGPLPLAEGVPILRGVLEGLARVHQAGVIHGDIKPANILLTREGIPKVADFGLASVREGRTVRMGTGGAFQGTPGFAAPEQLRGEAPSALADVYAAGVLARQMLAAPLPLELEAIILRASAPGPQARWPTVAAMRDALSAVDVARGPLLPIEEKDATDVDQATVL